MFYLPLSLFNFISLLNPFSTILLFSLLNVFILSSTIVMPKKEAWNIPPILTSKFSYAFLRRGRAKRQRIEQKCDARAKFLFFLSLNLMFWTFSLFDVLKWASRGRAYSVEKQEMKMYMYQF